MNKIFTYQKVKFSSKFNERHFQSRKSSQKPILTKHKRERKFKERDHCKDETWVLTCVLRVKKCWNIEYNCKTTTPSGPFFLFWNYLLQFVALPLSLLPYLSVLQSVWKCSWWDVFGKIISHCCTAFLESVLSAGFDSWIFERLIIICHKKNNKLMMKNSFFLFLGIKGEKGSLCVQHYSARC